MKTNSTAAKIAKYARTEARRAISVRRVNPAQADEILAEAQAEVARMRAAAGLTSSATAWL